MRACRAFATNSSRGDGKPRPHWLHFLQALAELDAGEISRRFASADRHIRDMGISYRVYGETGERSWPLSHLPLLIGEGEWREIAAGVEQRARSSKRFSAISMAKGASSATATSRPPPSPEARISCVRSRA